MTDTVSSQSPRTLSILGLAPIESASLGILKHPSFGRLLLLLIAWSLCRAWTYFSMQYIVKQDFCTLEKGVPLLKSDELHFEVDYDMTRYPGWVFSLFDFDSLDDC